MPVIPGLTRDLRGSGGKMLDGLPMDSRRSRIKSGMTIGGWSGGGMAACSSFPSSRAWPGISGVVAAWCWMACLLTIGDPGSSPGWQWVDGLEAEWLLLLYSCRPGPDPGSPR